MLQICAWTTICAFLSIHRAVPLVRVYHIPWRSRDRNGDVHLILFAGVQRSPPLSPFVFFALVDRDIFCQRATFCYVLLSPVIQQVKYGHALWALASPVPCPYDTTVPGGQRQ